MRNFKVDLIVPENKTQQSCYCTLIPGHTLMYECTLIVSGASGSTTRGIINVQNIVITNGALDTQPLVRVTSSTPPGRVTPELISISVDSQGLKLTLKNMPCTREASICGTLFITQYSHKLWVFQYPVFQPTSRTFCNHNTIILNYDGVNIRRYRTFFNFTEFF